MQSENHSTTVQRSKDLILYRLNISLYFVFTTTIPTKHLNNFPFFPKPPSNESRSYSKNNSLVNT